MAKAKYLVTGGAGFIGSHIAETLLKQGEAVRILDNIATGRQANLEALREYAERVEFIDGDIRDAKLVRTAVEGTEVVFHQAALASVPRSIADPVASLETNINGTQNVLLAARDAGVRRVVYASSSSVYGNTPTLPKHEEMPTAPMSPYAVQKLTGELLCGVFTRIYGLETVALRYFNVFGPRQDPASEYAAVIPRFITALLEKRRPIVFGDGEQTRDFTYVENVVQANLLAATAPAASGAAMNVGCGDQISLNSVLQIAGDLLGVRVDAEYREPRAGDVRDSLADISKAQRLLGYKPTVDFREGLARTIRALEAGR
ncbi:SDR family oxidoreductase [Ktedonosporobacter rubrisoli]|uniref:SDR family oxidoreductase n=2 Tax=Ktedonosporobacter rubrisoli TaxID=2509675 RepID=A0A4P6K5A2_KTERU|nr:SDR family oxidoreductase [Ktedonosporobacter rubrisoli]